MAKDDKKDEREDEAEEGEAKPKAASGGRKKLILIIAAVLGLVGVSVGGTMLVSSLLNKEEPVKKTAKKKAPATPGEDAEDKEGAAKEGEGKEPADATAEAEEEDDTVNPDGSKRLAAYYDFEQPFVVNFIDEGQLRYLQITVSVMYMDPKTLEELKRHMPLIRNNLVMLFSNQSRDVIITREGKEKVRVDAEAEVKKVLRERTGKPMIKSLYFTSFVMQ